MAKLNIVIAPDPILLAQSAIVAPEQINSPDFQRLLQDMAQTMVEADGVGLAAPQIGKNIRVIIVTAADGPLMMVNPVLTKRSWHQAWGEEGCLSLPETFGQVKRHVKVRCKFLDQTGTERQIEASDLLARIIQHEVDHLDGILFTSKAKDIVHKTA